MSAYQVNYYISARLAILAAELLTWSCLIHRNGEDLNLAHEIAYDWVKELAVPLLLIVICHQMGAPKICLINLLKHCTISRPCLNDLVNTVIEAWGRPLTDNLLGI